MSINDKIQNVTIDMEELYKLLRQSYGTKTYSRQLLQNLRTVCWDLDGIIMILMKGNAND